MKKILLIMLMAVLLTACGESESKDTNDSRQPNNSVESGDDNKKPEKVHLTADYKTYSETYTLASSADVLFYGTVVSKKCKMLEMSDADKEHLDTGVNEVNRIPYTIYEIETGWSHGGGVQSTEYIKVPGGKVEDIEYDCEFKDLNEGEEYFFLCTSDSSDYFELVNNTQSVYSVSKENDEIESIKHVILPQPVQG